MIRLTLVRHGESQSNVTSASTIWGRADASPLTDHGRSQALALGNHWKKNSTKITPPDAVFASTAARASSTCLIALEAAEFHVKASGNYNTAITWNADLREMGQGVLMGKKRANAYQNLAPILSAMLNGWYHFSAPDDDRSPGESQSRLEGRAIKCLVDLGLIPDVDTMPAQVGNDKPKGLNEQFHGAEKWIGKHVMMFSHGMIMNCLVRGLFASDPTVSVKTVVRNTGTITLDIWPETATFEMVEHGNVDHLPVDPDHLPRPPMIKPGRRVTHASRALIDAAKSKPESDRTEGEIAMLSAVPALDGYVHLPPPHDLPEFPMPPPGWSHAGKAFFGITEDDELSVADVELTDEQVFKV